MVMRLVDSARNRNLRLFNDFIMGDLFQQALLVNLVALVCLIGVGRAVSTGCSDVCEYYEWGKEARCQGRYLTYVPQECNSAKTLRMQDNRLQQLVKGSFSNFTYLKYLYLDRNNLTLENGAFEGCSRLQQIHLNEICTSTIEPDMMTGLSNVLYMFMNKAGIEVIQPVTFQNMSQLKYLSLQENKLTAAPCDAFSSANSLQTLYLDSNKITQLSDDCFSRYPHLTKLYLKNNPLGDLNGRAFNGLTNLNHLDLQYTNLTRVPTGIFPYANRIHTLQLSFNDIQFLHNRDFASLTVLRKLYIQHNRIISIQSRSFEFLDSLNVLDLSFNRIESIETSALDDFRHLTDLRLQNNSLNSTRNITFSSIPQVTQLDLSHNPLHCDCSIYPLQYRLEAISLEGDLSYMATCASPARFKGQLIADLSHHDICPSAGDNMPQLPSITPKTPLFQKDPIGHPQLSKMEDVQPSTGSLDSKMIYIITGVAVAIILSVGLITIIIMRWRHKRRNIYKTHGQYQTELKHGMKPSDPAMPVPARLMTITENPMDQGPELPPRRHDVFPNGRRSQGSLGISSTQPQQPSHPHTRNIIRAEESKDSGYISPLVSASTRPPLSPQCSLSTSNSQDDGDYSEVFVDDQSCGENEEPSAAEWVSKNFVPPEADANTNIDQPPDQKKDTEYIPWRT
ncbi:leucine-rich repeat-containing protein 15-like isoform X1 [Lytechinus pictus]|uniref:leucine-rich repeat-containing protein 15-like isoform X1 n=2 Tax=Lytechinus pictus TaxID=7653 RepID=UPI0030B9EA4A